MLPTAQNMQDNRHSPTSSRPANPTVAVPLATSRRCQERSRHICYTVGMPRSTRTFPCPASPCHGARKVKFPDSGIMYSVTSPHSVRKISPAKISLLSISLCSCRSHSDKSFNRRERNCADCFLIQFRHRSYSASESGVAADVAADMAAI